MLEKKLKILQIAPIGLPVSREMKYGGTERVILYTDEEFTRKGHTSIVAGSGDSKIRGRLFATIPESLWKIKGKGRKIVDGEELDQGHYRKCVDLVLGKYPDWPKLDIIHDHPGLGMINSKAYKEKGERVYIPILNTLHGKFSKDNFKKYAEWIELLQERRKVYFNAISENQRKDFEDNLGISIVEVIYHGIPLELFPFWEKPKDYLFSLGRISHEKGQHIAIEVAKKTGRPLVIAGEVHSVNEDYWNEKIKPHIDDDQIKFIGPLNDAQKAGLYKNAYAFLMPIQWPEPFGLVMIEAMATGTAVIAFNRGSVSEIVKDNETGYIIPDTGNSEEDLNLMVQAVNNTDRIDRSICRADAEKRFTSKVEAKNYIDLYRKLMN